MIPAPRIFKGKGNESDGKGFKLICHKLNGAIHHCIRIWRIFESTSATPSGYDRSVVLVFQRKLRLSFAIIGDHDRWFRTWYIRGLWPGRWPSGPFHRVCSGRSPLDLELVWRGRTWLWTRQPEGSRLAQGLALQMKWQRGKVSCYGTCCYQECVVVSSMKVI